LVDSKKIEDWFNMAKKDFNGAKILYEHGGDYYLICFHCQQTIGMCKINKNNHEQKPKYV